MSSDCPLGCPSPLAARRDGTILTTAPGERYDSAFDATGNLGHSFVLRSDLDRWMRPRPLAVQEDGTILSVVGEVDSSLRVEIWDGEGRLHGSLGRQPNQELITARGPDGHTETVPAAYSSELVLVFDPEGRVLGFVETPQGLDILQIGDDFILGRVKDEFEVEYVQVWPLERTGT